MPEIISSSQIKITLEIFKNPGISLRGIIEKTRLSPNFVLSYVNMLIRRGFLKEEKLEKKRVYLRRFFINFHSKLAKSFFSLVKEEEKEIFYKKYQKLKPVLEQLSSLSRIKFLLVYGSYARLSAEKDSDLDLLIVGNKINKTRIREILVSLDIEVSMKVETPENFKKKINDALHKQILKENILVSGSEEVLDFLFRGE
jgi:predicted nucleotidyltransferase